MKKFMSMVWNIVEILFMIITELAMGWCIAYTIKETMEGLKK